MHLMDVGIVFVKALFVEFGFEFELGCSVKLKSSVVKLHVIQLPGLFLTFSARRIASPVVEPSPHFGLIKYFSVRVVKVTYLLFENESLDVADM